MSEFHAPVFMFSGEGRRLDLPVRARIVRYLSAIDIARKAAVLSFSHPVYDGRFTELAVLAKGRELVSDVFDGVQVGLYVLPVDVRVGETELDVSDGLQPVLDWCELTLDEPYARESQERMNAA